ncbi:hypothetical protein V1264_007416 [Littorina saxatilis]|uniref:BHLH domain-containing protein n=1 Tax=Littorina saxatilis TaxID=31220 RepID=A0AAN9AUT5_9CAEN
MEKRRRARINASLADLKCLLPGGSGREGSRSIKMEKADILERAVEHLKLLQEINQCGETPSCCAHHPTAKSESLPTFDQGYQECLDDVDKYLVRMRTEDAEMRAQVMKHIASKKAGFKHGQFPKGRLCHGGRLKRCGTLSRGSTKKETGKKLAAQLLSSYQHTHSPADSTTPEDHGDFGEESADDSGDEMNTVDDENESFVKDNDQRATVESESERITSSRKSGFGIFEEKTTGTPREIKQENLPQDKDNGQDPLRLNGTPEYISNNNSSSGNKRNTPSAVRSSSNRDTDNESIHRKLCSSFFLNPNKAPSLIITTKRPNCSSSNIGSKRLAISSSPSFHGSSESLEGSGSEDKQKDLYGPVFQKPDLYKSFSQKPAKHSSDSSTEHNYSTFSNQLTTQGRLKRLSMISPTPFSEQLSITIPSTAASKLENQPPCLLPQDNYSQAPVVTGNDVMKHAQSRLVQQVPLLLMTSSRREREGDRTDDFTGRLFTACSDTRTEPANLLVAQLIKPLNESHDAPQQSGWCDSASLAAEEDQACDLSMKRAVREGNEGKELVKGLRCESREEDVQSRHNTRDDRNCLGGGDSNVWRPW